MVKNPENTENILDFGVVGIEDSLKIDSGADDGLEDMTRRTWLELPHSERVFRYVAHSFAKGTLIRTCKRLWLANWFGLISVTRKLLGFKVVIVIPS